MDSLTEDQLRRYETFRRSGLERSVLKKVIQCVITCMFHFMFLIEQWIQGYLGQSVHLNIAIVAAGVAKVYVGELVEEALQVKRDWGDSGCGLLLPSHIREAHRRLGYRNGSLSPKSFTFTNSDRIV
jgi:transcription initiation factor TFIID subunit 11